MRIFITGLVAVLVIGAAGFYVYDYLVKKPPAWLISLVTKTDPPPPLPSGDQAPLTVPEGFSATIFARDVAGARVMTLDQKGTMLVSQTKGGRVIALPDMDADGKADRSIVVLEGLSQPHGILVVCEEGAVQETEQAPCLLYVAETGVLRAYQYDADTFSARLVKTVGMFPTGDGHFTRTLLAHPDGQRLLVSVGSSCNVCNETQEKRATVQAVTLGDNLMSTFAEGLRNTVFMAVHPVTGEVWGTDNGRDMLGDAIPPDEVNIIREGEDYGWPICYGANVHDTDFDNRQYVRNPCEDKTPPHIELPAHAAALGLAFVPEEGWPEEMWHDLLVAYHGSWNRSEPEGYKVVRFNLSAQGALLSRESIDVVTGFLPQEATDTDSAIGRPVDMLVLPGGVMYLSDDRAGAIYRIALTVPPR